MADDGLLLNLSIDEAPIRKVRSSITGGRWKDRLKAKKSAKQLEQNQNPEKRAVPKPKIEDSESRKRKREYNDKETQANSDIKAQRPKLRPNDRDKSGKDTFVSSLFTSNPLSETKPAPSKERSASVEASNAPLKDSTTFEGLGINEQLCTLLTDKMGLKQPTRIQRAVLPRLIYGERDLYIQAQTGSGKTLAYILPILERLMNIKALNRTSGLFAIILVPTRELSNQIHAVLEQFSRLCHWIVPGVVIGGEKKKSEKSRIRKGINILVATPGRLVDHFDNTEALNLSQVRWVILDEGDRLMELGFEETITKILGTISEKSKIHKPSGHIPGLPNTRINVLCSATMKATSRRLQEISLTNADWVTPESAPETQDNDNNLKMNDEAGDQLAPAQLLQEQVIVPAKLRLVALASILMNLATTKPDAKIMVFCSCSDSVEFYFSVFARGASKNLIENNKLGEDDDETDDNVVKNTVMPSPWLGDKAVIYKLHGSLTQPIRTSTLAAFSGTNKNAKTQGSPSVMFCTDVASRGLDLPYISNVVEFDPPAATEDHLHRVGRTARAGKNGSSIIFLLPGKEEKYLDLIKPFHPNGIKSVEHRELMRTAFGKTWEVDATTWHLDVERTLLESDEMLKLGRRAFTSHIRAYATHAADERQVFDLKSLHLGHIAKSFGLRETPGSFSTGSEGSNKKKNKNGQVVDGRKRMLRMAKFNTSISTNEFNIG